MKRIVPFLLLAVVLAGIFIVTSLGGHDTETPETELLRQRFTKETRPSVDHAKFTQLQKQFTTPQQVTEACIACHNGRHDEVMLQGNHRC